MSQQDTRGRHWSKRFITCPSCRIALIAAEEKQCTFCVVQGRRLPVNEQGEYDMKHDQLYPDPVINASEALLEQLEKERVAEAAERMTAALNTPPVSALDHQPGGNHYANKAIQPIEYIVQNDIPYREGNVIKYITRWREKNGVEDLRKAKHYIDMLIEEELNA